ncbi:MAG: GTP-binding protein [Candidatus Heimdallarchaeota archaeon]|nr:GTP-binding protein [Candidatus Heimdallarchaeota archaeon]
MEKSSIPVDQWGGYLDDLYNWINEKYQLLEQGAIDQKEYEEHSEYYDKEKARIEGILNQDSVEDSDTEPVKENKKEEKARFTQETFEKFFGISLDDESSESTSESSHQRDPNSIIDTSNAETDESVETEDDEDNLWQYVGESTPTSDFLPFDEQKKEGDEALVSANILLIGDSSVGRTSLRRSWMGKHFISQHLTTIGASIEKKTMSIDGQDYNITLTDLGGQDFYSDLRRNFYRNIDGAIIVFDLTRPETFRRIEFWVKEFYKNGKRLVPFIIVGNKNDEPNRAIPKKNGDLVAQKYSQLTLPKFRVRYLETSAKTNSNVNEVFEIICREIKAFKVAVERKSHQR